METSIKRLIAINYTVRPTYIAACPEFDRTGYTFSKRQIENRVNLANHRVKGKLSAKSGKNLKNAINWLVLSAKYKRVWSKLAQKHYTFKLNFVTLTIPFSGSLANPKQVKNVLLHNFLQVARYQFGLRNYVWKLEAHKTGQVHIHLTSDTFMHMQALRDVWNRILKKNGYLENYAAMKGHYNAPSTEVKAVKNIRNMASYLAKYFSKNEQANDAITGRLWGCNYELSEGNKLQVSVDPFSSEKISNCINYRKIELKKIESLPDIFGQRKWLANLYLLKLKDWGDNVKGELWGIVQEHLFCIQNNNHLFDRKPVYNL